MMFVYTLSMTIYSCCPVNAISPLTECVEAPDSLCHNTADVGELDTFLLGTEYWYSVLSKLGAEILLARLWL